MVVGVSGGTGRGINMVRAVVAGAGVNMAAGAGVDMVVGTYVTMSLIVVNTVMPMNLISLSIVQNSLKRQHTVVKSLFPCGEETDKRSDAATARNVRANGSLFAHLAL